MALEFFWKSNIGYGGYDMHLVRNNVTAEALTKSIYVKDTSLSSPILLDDLLFPLGPLTLAQQTIRNSISSYSFLPNTVNALSTNSTNTVLDVDIKTDNGEVKAKIFTGSLDYLENFNFIITAEFNVGSDTHSLRIRCHVHKAMTAAWLTPTQLTVRPGADGFRYSVLAQFSDDVVGDISRHPGFGWTVQDNGSPASPSDINITNLGKITVGAGVPQTLFSATGASALGRWTVTATLPAYLVNTASFSPVSIPNSILRIGLDWNLQANTPDLSLITNAAAGKDKIVAQPGPEKYKEVKNFLFFADGFDLRASFDKICDGIRYEISTATDLSPWNHLSSDINFWKFFIPSRQEGITCLSEMFLVKKMKIPTSSAPYGPSTAVGAITETLETFGTVVGKANSFLMGGKTPFYNYKVNTNSHPDKYYYANRTTPINREETNPVGNFNKHQLLLDELVDIIGLPNKFDAAASLQNLKTNKWSLFNVRLLFNGQWNIFPTSTVLTYEGQTLPSGDLPNVTDDLFECWRRCADRYLVDEIDSTFGISTGGRPNLENTFDPSIVTFHPFRANRIDHMNGLLGNLAKKINASATNWTFSGTPGNYVPDDDFSTVIALCGGAAFAGANTHTDSSFSSMASPSQLIAFALQPSKKGYNFSNAGSGGSNKRRAITPWPIPDTAEPAFTSFLTHELGHSFSLGDEYGAGAAPATFSTDLQNSIDSSKNLQEKTASLQSSLTLDADLVKWRFLRLEKAAVLQVDLVSNGTNYDITVKTEDADLFIIGELVHLTNQPFINIRDSATAVANPNTNDKSHQPASPYLSNSLIIISKSNVSGNDSLKLITVSGIIDNVGDYLKKTSKLIKTRPTKFTGKGKINTSGTALSGVLNANGTPTTAFGSELSVPFEIIVGSERRYVTYVTSDSAALINAAFPSNLTNAEYKVQPYGGVYSLTGTISSAGTSVTGSGTLFKTELRNGALLFSNGEIKKVLQIINDSSLTLYDAFATNLNNASVFYSPPLYHAEVLSDIVRRHMISNAKELTNTGISSGCDPNANLQFPRYPTLGVLFNTGGTLIPKLSTPEHKFELVGLYSGGSTFGCGVYHPTGSCIMINASSKVKPEDAETPLEFIEVTFCPVCKYTLVELISPGRHNSIDAEYQSKYPKLK